MGSCPDYDNLPIININGKLKRCAWGIFDKDGQKDVYGCLNKVTPEIVARAATEVTHGVTISLNWPLRVAPKPGFGRKGLVHKVISFVNSPLQIHGYDDEVEFNTQCSSQWDALCHFYDQDLQRGYNGSNPSIHDLVQDYGEEDHAAKIPTLNHWHARGGLATRGVLIDYKAYAERKGIRYSPFSAHKITISEIEEIASDHGIEFRPGDVFLLRTGFTEAVESTVNEAEKIRLASSPDSAGVEDAIMAVPADNPGFEVMRPTKGGVDGSGILHPNFLSLLGLHIGELWDLKRLSAYCHSTGRFTFMLTSVPLNYAGSCGSPPNAMALF
ncbi:hypothetical protein BGW36DRAFT_398798 [Talaromyces proteolyticus]|uniref:Cyclase n=1 Tax=Talaromyces proteolyticus TaxID=1131652 RepID=A0AAD4KRY4_9EURO|nr:uncharacterized protein BGW36DRAFT_398798 [Talaromyces proteolyticus]KAH8695616.1 hypothetical protein BGW36DRAFT_398798 [Talaromyces proteolyticus]